MVGEFHEHGTFIRSVNTTFVFFIPNKGGAENIGDFKPISIVGQIIKFWPKSFL